LEEEVEEWRLVGKAAREGLSLELPGRMSPAPVVAMGGTPLRECAVLREPECAVGGGLEVGGGEKESLIEATRTLRLIADVDAVEAAVRITETQCN
jgi:hypothetical protein